MTIKLSIEKAANRKFLLMIEAAYEYYWNNESIMPDWEYDLLTQEVSRIASFITNKSSHLVDFESLLTCSSLHYISKIDLMNALKIKSKKCHDKKRA